MPRCVIILAQRDVRNAADLVGRELSRINARAAPDLDVLGAI
jgi:hypothetical protein